MSRPSADDLHDATELDHLEERLGRGPVTEVILGHLDAIWRSATFPDGSAVRRDSTRLDAYRLLLASLGADQGGELKIEVHFDRTIPCSACGKPTVADRRVGVEELEGAFGQGEVPLAVQGAAKKGEGEVPVGDAVEHRLRALEAAGDARAKLLREGWAVWTSGEFPDNEPVQRDTVRTRIFRIVTAELAVGSQGKRDVEVALRMDSELLCASCAAKEQGQGDGE